MKVEILNERLLFRNRSHVGHERLVLWRVARGLSTIGLIAWIWRGTSWIAEPLIRPITIDVSAIAEL